MGVQPHVELLNGLRSLYNSKEYTDLVIVTSDGSRHLVHRSLVCSRSRFFQDLVRSGQWLDGEEGRLALIDHDAQTVRMVLDYFYLLDYEPAAAPPAIRELIVDASTSDESLSRQSDYGQVYGTPAIAAFGGHTGRSDHLAPGGFEFSARVDSPLTVHAMPTSGFSGWNGGWPTAVAQSSRRRGTTSKKPMIPDPSPLATKKPNLLLHARMHAAGHHFEVEGLRMLALDKFKIQLTRHWDSLEFAEAIHIVYSTIADVETDMRDAIADTIHWHPQLLDKPEIEVAITDINGLAYELLKRSRRVEPEYL